MQKGQMMMRDYVIVTDSSCDMPAQLAQDLELVVLPLTVLLEGREYKNYLDEREITFADFYAALRSALPPPPRRSTPTPS